VRTLPERSRPIKVVYVINSLGVGGAERMLCDLVTGLDPDRFQAEVICLYYAGKLSRALESSNIPVRVLDLDRRFVPQNWLRTWRALGSGADVIHTHLPESNWYGLPAGYLNRVPVRISHLHSVYLRWSAKTKVMDRAIRVCASLSVACSGAVRDAARDLGYSDRKLRVIPNGVETTRFDGLPTRGVARRTLGLSQDGPVLISVASLYEHKGHSYLLEAMVRVREEFPQTTLLLVGDAKKEERRTVVRDAVERLGLREAVWFLGHREDVPLLLAASDVFVMPSVREGFPMALLEAGAAGLPAVASSVGGIPEIIDDGTTGLLVPSQDEGRLGETLLSLLRDPSRMRSMGEAARTRIQQHFALRQTVRQLENLYVDLLAHEFPRVARLLRG
jgi:glycosyltransferase involved in cell wall biosynthesis